MEHIIKNHNGKITESSIEKSVEASCNWKEKNICQLEENCLVKNIVYMATVTTETNTSSYVGMTGNHFITRYYNHLKSLKNKRYKNETELSKYLWKIKEKEVEHTVTCEKLRQCNTCLRRSGYVTYVTRIKPRYYWSKGYYWSTQLNRRFEVSTCRPVSPPTSIAPKSEHINTEPNRPPYLCENYRRHRRMWNTVSQRAEVSVTLTVIALRLRYWALYFRWISSY